jgi:hypothetical protein
VKYKLYRRTFTKLSLLSGGALFIPAIGVARAAASAEVVLTDEEGELIDAFAEAMLPTEGTPLKPRSDVPIADNVARALSLMDEPTREQVRMGLKLFDYGAYLIGFHFTRFANLSAERRLAYIHRWEDGVAMQRGIVDVLKKLTYVGYWQDIEAGRMIGYRGPVSVAGGIPNLGNAPMPRSD